MMRLLLIIVLMIASAFSTSSQIVINSRFKPLSYEELMLEAQYRAAYEAQQEQRFEKYKDYAYVCYNRQDWNGFLTYTNYALGTGWYTAKMYYDRGVVYELLGNFKNAKKEYKKAKKKGYAYAEQALQSLKIKEKEYKRLRKRR